MGKNKSGRGKRTIKTPLTMAREIAAFFDHLSRSGNITRSAAAAGLDPGKIRRWRKVDDPTYGIIAADFAAAFDEAYDLANDYLEDCATHRGTAGVLKDIYYQGDVVGQEVVYSDGLLQFMLRARRPDKFKNAVAVDAQVKGSVTVLSSHPSDDAL